MKIKNLIRLILALVLVTGFSSAWAAQTIKWSMQGDSLTLDPHAQNEGPTTQVSRQVYEALVQRGLDMKIGPALATSWKATDPNTWVFQLRKDAKFFSDHALDIIKMFDSWFKRIGFGLLVVILTA